jgi:hypothetical protein
MEPELTIRYAQQYDSADDSYPLHPDFYEFIQKDDSGYFIELPDGTRIPVTVK